MQSQEFLQLVGELLRPLTIDDLKRGEFEPITRNKVIVRVLVEERKVALPDKILRALDTDQLKILEIVEKKGRIQTSDCEEAIGKVRRTIIRKLTELVNKGILIQIGKRGKAVYYQLHKKFKR